MAKTAMIRARTEPKLKNEVERIFRELGLTSTEAINLFYQQVRLQHGLPFEIKIPNAETLKAIEAVDNKKGLVKSKNAKEMFKKLGI